MDGSISSSSQTDEPTPRPDADNATSQGVENEAMGDEEETEWKILF